MAGDRETGVMVMKMDEGLDTGAVAMAQRVTIGSDVTTGDLHDELARLGAKLMPVALGALERGSLTLTPQAATGAIYAAKIDKTETRIDWTRPWQEVHNHCRGLSPFPGAWFEHPGLGRIKVLRTTKGDGQGPPGAVLDESSDRRLRQRRRAHHRTATRRRQTDADGRVFAWHACGLRKLAELSGGTHAPLQAHHRI